MAKLLRIPIERFKANRAIIENVFLEFPRNKKSILVLNIGDSLDEGYLEKLQSKGVKYLCFSVIDGDTRDPNTCELFLQTTNVVNKEGSPVEASVATTSTADAPSLIVSVDNAHTIEIAAPTSIEGPAQKFSEEITSEDSKSFSAEPKAVEEVITLEPDQKMAEEEKVFSANSPEENQIENRFSADQIKKDSSELRFSKNPEEHEEIRTIRASSAKEDDEEEFRFTQSSNEDKTNEFSNQNNGSANEIDPFASIKVKSLTQLKDMLIEGQTIDFPASRDALFKDLKSKVFGSKLEKKLVGLLENVSDLDSANEELRDLEQKLKKIRNGYIDEEVEAEFSGVDEIGRFEKLIDLSPTPVPELMTTIEHIEEMAQIASNSLEEAYAVVSAKKSNANQNNKDAASSLSKLAAYLGSAIGYSNIDFLAELGFGVVYQYQQRLGMESSTEKLPPFSRRALMDTYTPNSLVDDYLNILKFLELYSSDPLVDLKDKEFSKKIFDRTLEKAKNADFSPDPMSLSQWVTFVEKGPSMDVHSICSKASAKALKFVRDASN